MVFLFFVRHLRFSELNSLFLVFLQKAQQKHLFDQSNDFDISE